MYAFHNFGDCEINSFHEPRAQSYDGVAQHVYNTPQTGKARQYMPWTALVQRSTSAFTPPPHHVEGLLVFPTVVTAGASRSRSGRLETCHPGDATWTARASGTGEIWTRQTPLYPAVLLWGWEV